MIPAGLDTSNTMIGVIFFQSMHGFQYPGAYTDSL